jgi:hypothetical protein
VPKGTSIFFPVLSAGASSDEACPLEWPKFFAAKLLMTRRAILTPQVLAGIPALVAQGLRKAEIAKRLGCREDTLQVRCSTAGISLSGRKLRIGDPLKLSYEAVVGLRERAASIGCSEMQLASDLLEVIARDNLYDAVLDVSAPMQPAE